MIKCSQPSPKIAHLRKYSPKKCYSRFAKLQVERNLPKFFFKWAGQKYATRKAIFNRPGVAGGVLQNLCDSFIN